MKVTIRSQKNLNIIAINPIQGFRSACEIVEEHNDKDNGLKIQFTTHPKLGNQTIRFLQERITFYD
jgi:hypothetical protein